jgi:DNA-binding GntR family transcriptional regulator
MFERVPKVFAVEAPLSRPASAIAAAVIREAIVDGRLGPGMRLKEEQLASELGISRTPIREALLLLQAEGLVEAVPNRGAFVRAFEANDLWDMYELRAVLEGHAARRAAERITDEELIELRASCERFDELVLRANPPDAELIQELVRENLQFHEIVLAAADSERLAGMVRQVVVAPLVYKSYVWYSPDQARASAYAHRQLVNAFEQHDSERAELLMREHVYEARDVLAGRLEAAENTT